MMIGLLLLHLPPDFLLQEFHVRSAFLFVANLTNNIGLFTDGTEVMADVLGLGLVDNDHHADSHIESAVHFGCGNAAFFSKKIEDREPRPFVGIDNGFITIR